MSSDPSLGDCSPTVLLREIETDIENNFRSCFEAENKEEPNAISMHMLRHGRKSGVNLSIHQ
jgi:hypothetical protein